MWNEGVELKNLYSFFYGGRNREQPPAPLTLVLTGSPGPLEIPLRFRAGPGSMGVPSSSRPDEDRDSQ